MKKIVLMALMLVMFVSGAMAIDQQWHYCYWTDSYIKISRKTGGWSEIRKEAATWHAVPYTGDCDSFVGSWLKDPAKNGLNWLFWGQALYDANGKPVKYGKVGVSRTGVLAWSYYTSPYDNRYGLMEFFPEYIIVGYGDYVWDEVTQSWVYDATAPVWYATTPWDYPGPGTSGGLD